MAMFPLADMIISLRYKGVDLVKNIERDAKPTPGSFKVLEQMVVPEDWFNFHKAMMAEPKKTLERLRHHATTIIRERWWTWILMHPDLSSTLIHSSRRMLLFT